MAFYTTELRRLLEVLDNRENHVELSGIAELINNTWQKVFYNDCVVESPLVKEDLCKDILNHYFMEEIGFETPALFLHYINNRFCEILPYYNEIAKALAVKYDFLNDTDITIVENLKKDGNENENGTQEIEASGNTSDTGNERIDGSTRFSHGVREDRYPQGFHDLNDNYLDFSSQAEDSTIIGNDTNTTANRDSTGKSTQTDSKNSTKNENTDRILTRKGKEGNGSYARYQREYIENLRNIKEEIVDEFEDLFILLLK